MGRRHILGGGSLSQPTKSTNPPSTISSLYLVVRWRTASRSRASRAWASPSASSPTSPSRPRHAALSYLQHVYLCMCVICLCQRGVCVPLSGRCGCGIPIRVGCLRPALHARGERSCMCSCVFCGGRGGKELLDCFIERQQPPHAQSSLRHTNHTTPPKNPNRSTPSGCSTAGRSGCPCPRRRSAQPPCSAGRRCVWHKYLCGWVG